MDFGVCVQVWYVGEVVDGSGCYSNLFGVNEEDWERLGSCNSVCGPLERVLRPF